jgi:pimeloyl-ACP methyl ester carboxylesterase
MSTTDQSNARPGDYVEAGGLRTYYEAYGNGEPVLLLPGGLCTAETFDGLSAPLGERHRVYVVERRGQGRTPDVDGPITYENMAGDTIAFFEALDIGSAHLVGWSDGALVGLHVALRRPELVRKLVLIGQYVNLDGARPEQYVFLERVTRDAFPPSFEQAYAAVSPDGPEHFGVVFDKLLPLWRSDPGFTPADLEDLLAPTLVLMGDDDVISLEHAAMLQRSIPDCMVAVVPGTSHALPLEKPDLVNRVVLDFLANEQPPKLLGTDTLRALVGAA